MDIKKYIKFQDKIIEFREYIIESTKVTVESDGDKIHKYKIRQLLLSKLDRLFPKIK